MMPVKPIPDGYHNITPYLIVEGVDRLIEFMKQAFDAVEDHRHLDGQGRIMHAQVHVGDSPIMMGEATGQWTPMPSTLHFYTENADALYARALAAGGESIMEPSDQFYGDRTAGVKDPSGNFWWLSTHIEDVSPEEMQRRQQEAGRA